MAGIKPGIPVSLRQQEATLTQLGLPDLNSHHRAGDGAAGHADPGLGEGSSNIPSAPRSLASFLPNTQLKIILHVWAWFSKNLMMMSILMRILDEEKARKREKDAITYR